MSGFEVAGVVLGSIPLVISALEHYKSGKSTAAAFLKYQGLLDVLILRLKNQRIIYYLNMMILLKAAGVDDLTNQDETACIDALMDADTMGRIREYLGFASGAFDDIILEYERCLKTIVAKLEHINRDPKAAKNDLNALLQVNGSNKGKFALRRRLHFTIERGSLKQLVEDLKDDNLSLETIVKGMKTMHEFEPSSPSSSATKLHKHFKSIQRAARSLYSAVSTGWMSCSHESHEVLIHLEDRVTKSHKKPKTLKKDQVSFEVFLSPDDKASSSERIWQQAVIEWLEEDSSQLNAASHSAFAKKTRIVVSSDSKPKTTPITNICKTVNHAIITKCDLSLHLQSTTLYMPDTINNSNPIRCFSSIPTPTMTLENFLFLTSSNEDLHLSYKQRTSLALRLASSILQLNSTEWFTGPWTSSTVHFFSNSNSDPNSNSNSNSPSQSTPSTCSIDASRPTLKQTLTQPTCKTPLSIDLLPSTAMGPDPEAAFLELALLLLEIWHHESFSSRLARLHLESPPHPNPHLTPHSPPPISDTLSLSLDSRRTQAIRWLQSTQSKLPLNYLRACEACLQFSSGRLRAWGEEDFGKQVCEDVVRPLVECWGVW